MDMELAGQIDDIMKNVAVDFAIRGIKTSDKTDELYKAMVGFQAEVENVTKAESGYKGRYKFAKLENVADVAKPILAKYGLGITSPPSNAYFDASIADNGNKGVYMINIITRVIHSSGQWQETISQMPVDTSNKMLNTSQAFGIALSYGRRYGWLGAFNIITEGEDTDGNVKSSKSAEPTVKSPISLMTYEAIISTASKVYAGEMEEMLPTLVKWASDKRVSIVKELFEDEAKKLVKGLNKKLEPVEEKQKES